MQPFLAKLTLKISCDNQSAMDVFDFFTAGTIPTLPLHGTSTRSESTVYTYYKIASIAFTILRGFALLQSHSWRLPATCVLVALALGVTVCDAVSNTVVDDP